MSYDIVEQLKKEIAGFKHSPDWESAGRIIEVSDGIIRFSGLSKTQSQELLTIETDGAPVAALALNLEDETVGALILGDASRVTEGCRVTGTGTILSIPVGDELIGRVVDPLCNPVDGKGPLFADITKAQRNTLENEAPSVVERESVNTPLHTGIKAIDAMIPIGRGQRELIIGDRTTGKTAIALDTIINQQFDTKRRRPICIYVAIGQKEAKTARIVETLREKGALAYTIVVSAPASSPASMWYLAPFTGCAIGEYFRDKGEDAVVVYDDLSKHAWGYREISLLLRRPPGREAYPGDVFYLHSRLLERAAKLSKEKGGGSLTALPIIETQLNDVTAYVPTNVISITDGQIYLESDLFNQGIRPAVNVGLSVSRVGSAAQTKAMKKVAGKLRLTLAQFRELQAFVQFASDVDEMTKKRIREGQVMTEVLKQNDLSPLPFEIQVVLFFAALRGRFNDAPLESLAVTQEKFIEYLTSLHAPLLTEIRDSGEITNATEAKLVEALERFSI
ncbi:MAG: F-type H+/Na+-transporting ATPase subunit alpha [Patescibacteria group bacterium]|jgi:F-type H+-transporting ATPase subunit alpha|nr:F-type H+/Na+-transporting ATPase subunit alpha [Patescibacteria group bacterium]